MAGYYGDKSKEDMHPTRNREKLLIKL